MADHVTISRFRAEACDAMAELFTEVLVLCARLGMGQLGAVRWIGQDRQRCVAKCQSQRGRVAQSRRRAGSDRRRQASGGGREAAAEHAVTDAAEDALYGPDRRGDELPAELADPRSRTARIAQALRELKAETAAGMRNAGRGA